MSLSEVKAQFENRSYYVRGEFLKDYHFQDEYRRYYIDFICQKAHLIRDENYLSDLIWFTLDVSFFENEVAEKWYGILKTSKSTIVILCALDYFFDIPPDKLPANYVESILQIATLRSRNIKNQVYLNLLRIDESNKNYKSLLFDSLKRTTDDPSIRRTITTTEGFKSKKLRREIITFVENLDRKIIRTRLELEIAEMWSLHKKNIDKL